MAVTFFAALSRMKYIDRWALMRASAAKNVTAIVFLPLLLCAPAALLSSLKHGTKRGARAGRLS